MKIDVKSEGSKAMVTETITYDAGSVISKAVLVYDEQSSARRPLLLMAPNWLGVSEDAIRRAEALAGDKYIVLVADMYGDGKVASDVPEAMELSGALHNDTAERRRRINAALDTLVTEAERRNIGNSALRAAVGFCFGGGNVLELARSGANLQATVCIHGDLLSSLPANTGDIRGEVLIIHGAQDPVVPKNDRDAIEAEMEAAGVRWQMLTFGGLLHSFSELETNMPGIAEYNDAAARQSYRMIDQFTNDAFNKTSS